MLVVVVIVLILAGLLLPVIKQAIEQGRRTKALAEIKQIETAWKEFKREYATFYKDPGGSVPILMDSNAVAVLSGVNSNLNPKLIQFLEAAPSSTGMLDPWKAPYRVAFDDDRNGKAFDNTIAVDDGSVKATVYSSVAVWSKGKNTGIKDAKDDITSWKR